MWFIHIVHVYGTQRHVAYSNCVIRFNLKFLNSINVFINRTIFLVYLKNALLLSKLLQVLWQVRT